MTEQELEDIMKKRTWQNRFEKISEKELEKVLNDVFWEFFWMPKLKQDILNNNNTTLED
tara:strand:+ start:376 stop:552 length:177 start_codon:yes stop_codon:yes gene_type:complete